MLSATRQCIRQRALQISRAYSPQRRWRTRSLTVLALESSADDTCAAIVTSERKILANVVLRQLSHHEAFGGIEPYVAIREHQRNMPIAVRKALDTAGLEMSQIDGIAFTRGPGMAGCLSVCSNAAKTLASALKKPLIGVHHMQAHALTSILTADSSSSVPTFPFLTLLISGGHTLLLLALSNTRFRILATTRDEAVGRTIDKVARALRLEWQGRAPGAALEAFCRDGLPGVEDDQIPHIPPLDVPLRGQLAFSFSGLHSIVDRYILAHGYRPEDSPPEPLEAHISESSRSTRAKEYLHKLLLLPDPHRVAIARAFQNAAIAQLEEKVVLALKWCAQNQNFIANAMSSINAHPQPEAVVEHVVIGGGVASNVFFRERLSSLLKTSFPDRDLELVFPPPSLCTDNAAMIAWASMHRFLAGEADDYSIDHMAKWSIEELDK
ncbi:hypothetical protein M0805_006637 [Coniferiporia weirii]|nr:hypothetical protein M0805_006637 [Coniferiporia weirii]